MTVQRVRKPPFGNEKIDRMSVLLDGNHSMKQKIAMLMQVKFWLHEQGIDHAGRSHFYIPLIDSDGHPLTAFRDGALIADYHLIVDRPYPCAADDYDRRPAFSVPHPF